MRIMNCIVIRYYLLHLMSLKSCAMEDTCNFKDLLSGTLIKISKNVRKNRLSMNFTQQDLSFLSDCERATISNIERCNYENISLKTLIKLSIVLDISLADILQ
jgi:DNA-binding XRE family transcriptional regulator